MFILIFHQLIKMLLIMLLAFLCYRLKIINQEGNKNFSNLLLLVVNPCLIITVFQTDYDAELVRGLLLSFLIAFLTHVIGIALAHVLVPQKNNPDYALDRFAAVYSNCGFIGIPLVNSVLGSRGVFFLTAYMTVFNILTWTHGLILLDSISPQHAPARSDIGTDNLDKKNQPHREFPVKRLKEGLLSPMIFGTLTGMVLFFLQIRIPSPLIDSMDYIASMNTPIAMMIAGFSVAQADLKKIFTHIRIYWISFLKLILVPFAVLVFLALLPIDREIAYTMLIAAACPTATTLTMMAIRLDLNYTYASEIFSFTTVLSVITIPAVTYAADLFL